MGGMDYWWTSSCINTSNVNVYSESNIIEKYEKMKGICELLSDTIDQIKINPLRNPDLVDDINDIKESLRELGFYGKDKKEENHIEKDLFKI